MVVLLGVETVVAERARLVPFEVGMNRLEEVLGIAFWIGFSLHLLAAEIWIHITRPSRATA